MNRQTNFQFVRFSNLHSCIISRPCLVPLLIPLAHVLSSSTLSTSCLTWAHKPQLAQRFAVSSFAGPLNPQSTFESLNFSMGVSSIQYLGSPGIPCSSFQGIIAYLTIVLGNRCLANPGAHWISECFLQSHDHASRGEGQSLEC